MEELSNIFIEANDGEESGNKINEGNNVEELSNRIIETNDEDELDEEYDETDDAEELDEEYDETDDEEELARLEQECKELDRRNRRLFLKDLIIIGAGLSPLTIVGTGVFTANKPLFLVGIGGLCATLGTILTTDFVHEIKLTRKYQFKNIQELQNRRVEEDVKER